MSLIKCTPQLMAKCPDKIFCGCDEEATYLYGSDCDKFAQQILSAPETNADHIRSMTDEELAETLLSHVHGLGFKCASCNNYGCIKCVTDWLGKPYKEADDGT